MKKVYLVFTICFFNLQLNAQKIINVVIPPATIQWQYTLLNTEEYGIKNTSVIGIEPFFVEVLNVNKWGFQASLSNNTFKMGAKGVDVLLSDAASFIDGDLVKVGAYNSGFLNKSNEFNFQNDGVVLFNLTLVKTKKINNLLLVYGFGANFNLFDNSARKRVYIRTNDDVINNYYFNFNRDVSRLGLHCKVGCNISLSKHLVLGVNMVMNGNRTARQDVYLYYVKNDQNYGVLKEYDNRNSFSFSLGGQLSVKYSMEYKKNSAARSIKSKANKFIFGH